MYHLRLKGDHYEMGVKRGKIFKKCQVSFPLCLDEFQLEHGKRSEAALRKYFPEVCEEIRGVSDAIGADYLRFASWMLCMGCCMYNLESNIPVEVRGCTAFAYVKGTRILYGRNNDFPPYLRDLIPVSLCGICLKKRITRSRLFLYLWNFQSLLTVIFCWQIKAVI